MDPLPLPGFDRPCDCAFGHAEPADSGRRDGLGCRDEADLAWVGGPIHAARMPISAQAGSRSSTSAVMMKGNPRPDVAFHSSSRAAYHGRLSPARSRR